MDDQNIVEDAYLCKEAIQKMVLQLLSGNNMTKEELAKLLGITLQDLILLCSKDASLTLLQKVNLPLIKLYCKTKS